MQRKTERFKSYVTVCQMTRVDAVVVWVVDSSQVGRSLRSLLSYERTLNMSLHCYQLMVVKITSDRKKTRGLSENMSSKPTMQENVHHRDHLSKKESQ